VVQELIMIVYRRNQQYEYGYAILKTTHKVTISTRLHKSRKYLQDAGQGLPAASCWFKNASVEACIVRRRRPSALVRQDVAHGYRGVGLGDVSGRSTAGWTS
jgi:hypothetical protein